MSRTDGDGLCQILNKYHRDVNWNMNYSWISSLQKIFVFEIPYVRRSLLFPPFDLFPQKNHVLSSTAFFNNWRKTNKWKIFSKILLRKKFISCFPPAIKLKQLQILFWHINTYQMTYISSPYLLRYKRWSFEKASSTLVSFSLHFYTFSVETA